MKVKLTCRDGTARNAAILHTQGELESALRTKDPPYPLDLIRSTLVETTSGVFTLGALVTTANTTRDGPAAVDRMVREARALGLHSLARALELARDDAGSTV